MVDRRNGSLNLHKLTVSKCRRDGGCLRMFLLEEPKRAREFHSPCFFWIKKSSILLRSCFFLHGFVR